MRERKSLLQKLLISFLLFITVQILIILAISKVLGLFQTGYSNSYHSFNYNMEVRAEMLEKMFRSVTRDLEYEIDIYNDKLLDMMAENEISVEEFLSNQELIDEYIMSEIESMFNYLLSHEEVHGAFIAFSTDLLPEGVSAVPGVYLRKDAVMALSDNYDNWYLLAGSPKIVEQYGIRYYHQWDLNLVNATEDKDYFNVPMQQAMESGSNDYYISRTFRFKADGDAVNTVTIPLLDEAGKPFGVAGVSFYMGTTMSNISSISLSNVNRGFYAIVDADDEDFTGQYITSNSLGESYLKSGAIKSTLINKENNIYRYESSDSSQEKMLGSYTELQLYGNDSPYKGMGYRLYSFVSEAELLADVNNFKTLAIIFFISFIIFSVFSIVFVSIQISKPVIRLANEVTSIDSNNQIKLKPTGISEIDLLLSALESFSEKLVQTASRFSSIIDLLDKPIGGFEESPTENRVFVTDSISRIFHAPYKGRYYISPAEWEELKARLSESGLEDYQDVYRCISEDMPERFLQVTTKMEADKTLGIIMDITEEIQEKMKLRVERDSDSLTKLYNRRGFSHHVSKRINMLPEGTLGAMIFIDLDNLKFVNDNYGHRVGDDYLKAMAGAFSILDESQSIKGRLSGDEFAIFVYGYPSQDAIRKVIIEAFDYFWNTCIYLPDGTPWKLCFSAGVAWWPEDAADYTTLLKYADFAMYQVKHTTKNSYLEFDKVRFAEAEKRQDFNCFD